MINISHLSKSYYISHQHVQALHDISLDIKPSEIFGIVGRSGSGKSTLFRILNGLDTPTSGTVCVLGQNIGCLNKKSWQLLRKRIGIIFQNFNLMYSLSVYKNVALPLEVQGLNHKEVSQRVNELLDIVGLLDKSKIKPGYLSGGQRQRVAIARALSTKPEILFCDEPTSALDAETSESILDLLVKINKLYGTTIVLISHDERSIQSRCHRIARFEHGKLLEVSNAS